MTKNYFAIDPAHARIKDQAIRGKIFLDYEEELEIPAHNFGAFFQVALIDPVTLLKGKKITTVDDFITHVDTICSIGGDQKTYPLGHALHDSNFRNNYIKGARVLYEDFIQAPCYNTYSVVFGMSEDDYAFHDNDIIQVITNCSLIINEETIDSFDTFSSEDTNTQSDYESLFALGKKLKMNNDIRESFHIHVDNPEEQTLGSYLSYASGYLLRRKISHLASNLNDKYPDTPEKQLPLIGKKGGSRTQDYLVLSQKKDFFPFTDLTRRPAALFNNIAVMHYRENGTALFNHEQANQVATYLNAQKLNYK